MINTIDNGIDIDFFNTIGIGIDIDKAIFKLLVLILILIRSTQTIDSITAISSKSKARLSCLNCPLLARAVLAIPASASKSERVFSKGGLLVT